MEKKPRLLTPTESAKILGISRQSVHKAIHEQRLLAIRVGNGWLLKLDDVESFVPRQYRKQQSSEYKCVSVIGDKD